MDLIVFKKLSTLKYSEIFVKMQIKKIYIFYERNEITLCIFICVPLLLPNMSINKTGCTLFSFLIYNNLNLKIVKNHCFLASCNSKDGCGIHMRSG